MGPDPSVQVSARPVSQEPMVCSSAFRFYFLIEVDMTVS